MRLQECPAAASDDYVHGALMGRCVCLAHRASMRKLWNPRSQPKQRSHVAASEI